MDEIRDLIKSEIKKRNNSASQQSLQVIRTRLCRRLPRHICN